MFLEHYKTELELAQHISKLEARVKGYKALCERLQAQADEMRSGQVPAAFVARVADLLHLLQFAEIKTPSHGDDVQAELAMNDLQRMLRETASVPAELVGGGV